MRRVHDPSDDFPVQILTFEQKESLKTWFDEELASRLNSDVKPVFIISRVHRGDLCDEKGI